MKKILFAIIGGCFLLTGCRETNLPFNFAKSIDSPFTTVVPVAEPHNVLIEEFTGQDCSNCPAAHDVLKEIERTHPGSINIIGLYVNGPSQTIPPLFSTHDFRDSTATDLGNTIYGGVGSMPLAGIDRVPVSGQLQLGSGLWAGTVNNQLSTAVPLNLSVQSSYNFTTNVATINVIVIYTKQVSTPQNISVVIVEDSITDIQTYPPLGSLYPSGYDTFYVFTNVFRSMLSPQPFGDPILAKMPTKDPGQGYRINYSYKPKNIVPAIKPEHCRVIAFVTTNNGNDYHVVQSKQCKLIP